MLKKISLRFIIFCFLWFIGSKENAIAQTAPIIADHNAVNQFNQIPESYFNSIRANYHIFYGHTSHGGQIEQGLSMLAAENPLYQKGSLFHEYNDDLGSYGDTSWVAPTESYLSSNPQTNIVIWSWCGGASGNTVSGINTYLQAMNGLEEKYPNVTFVYMTGHLDGTGNSGNLRARNNQIREYCRQNNKVLFDFADIESYDPNGTFYPNDTDACNWCSVWCSTHSCPATSSCNHSHCFNCYLKAKAFWWMMARIAGWQSGQNPQVPTATPTPTILPTATPTPIPPGNVSLEFRLRFQGTENLDQLPAKNVKITFKQNGVEKRTVNSFSLTPNSNSQYSGRIDDIPQGTYDIFIKSEGFLQRKFENVAILNQENYFNWTNDNQKLIVGDFITEGRNNNLLNLVDIAAILQQYTALQVDVTEQNRLFDVNHDNVINILDIGLVLSNWTQLEVYGDE